MAKGKRVPTAAERTNNSRWETRLKGNKLFDQNTPEGRDKADEYFQRKREQPSEYEHKRWMEEYHRRTGRAGKK